MDDDEYSLSNKGTLKLKAIADPAIKRKKKKAEKKKEDQSASTAAKIEDQQDIEAAIAAKMRERNPLLHKTKAELRYLHNTSKMQEKRVMDKASKTHKMRVEEFNKHLDNLTEHFDIPKVSWTK